MQTLLVALISLAAVQAMPQGFNFGFNRPQSSATGSASGNVVSGTGGGSRITSVSATAQGSVQGGNGFSRNRGSATSVSGTGLFQSVDSSDTKAESEQGTFGGNSVFAHQPQFSSFNGARPQFTRFGSSVSGQRRPSFSSRPFSRFNF